MSLPGPAQVREPALGGCAAAFRVSGWSVGPSAVSGAEDALVTAHGLWVCRPCAGLREPAGGLSFVSGLAVPGRVSASSTRQWVYRRDSNRRAAQEVTAEDDLVSERLWIEVTCVVIPPSIQA